MASASRRRGSAARPLPPFPAQQMFVLSLCRICEPIAFMSIFPYIYYMVKDFNITDDESQISVYAGLVTSAFTFAEFATGFMWGRISDKIGRKPVLLTGLAGTGLSVLLFGFAPNLPVALFARALGGLLNGNMGVLQTTVAELVTVTEHQPRAYSIMPMIWCIGSIAGPMVGGALAKPVETLPAIFPPGSIWDRFPYLLPNIFSASVVLMSVTVGFLFLDETHAEKKLRYDPGRAVGKYLLSLTPWGRPEQPCGTKGPEAQSLLHHDAEEPLPGYRTQDSSPTMRLLHSSDVHESLNLGGDVDSVSLKQKPRPVFNRPIVFIIITFGLLAFHTMTFDAELPVFLSSQPDPSKPTSLPFKFPGGFGFDTKRIGVILSVQGFYSLVSTTFLFPMVARWLSPLTLFRLLSVSYFLLYLVTPYLVLLPENMRMVGIYTIVVWKCTWSTLAYPSNAILLTNSAPTLLSLGTINGVAASTASLSRGFGPIISGALYTLGIETGYSGLMWWVTALVTLVGAAVSFGIPEPRGRMCKDDEEAVSEAVNPNEGS